MKTVIIYHSEHHGNTEKVVRAIAEQENVTLLKTPNVTGASLDGYDLIGFASGIYYGKFHDNVLRFAKEYLPPRKDVFFLYTCGINRKGYTDDLFRIAGEIPACPVGTWHCSGYDTFGPFKLIGGIAKGRPNEKDIAEAVQFFRHLADKRL